MFSIVIQDYVCSSFVLSDIVLQCPNGKSDRKTMVRQNWWQHDSGSITIPCDGTTGELMQAVHLLCVTYVPPSAISHMAHRKTALEVFVIL